jgi:multidrug resistance efflux pump
MSVRNKFLIILGVIFSAALTYYFISTPSNKDLILIGTVDSNQIIVSPQVNGRLARLLVDEGTPVKQ